MDTSNFEIFKNTIFGLLSEANKQLYSNKKKYIDRKLTQKCKKLENVSNIFFGLPYFERCAIKYVYVYDIS